MFSVQNVINTMVTSTTNILNSSAQNCLTSATNNSIIKISCDPTLRARSPGLANYCKDNKIVISGNTWKQYSNLKSNCSDVVKDTVVTKQETLNKVASDTATSLTKGLNITDLVIQKNIVDQCVQVVNVITNIYNQDCVANVTNINSILVSDYNGDINIVDNSSDQFIKEIQTCTMKNSKVTDAIQKLYNIIGISPPSDNSPNNTNNNDNDNDKGDNSNQILVNFFKNYGFLSVVGIMFLSGLIFSKGKWLTNPIVFPCLGLILSVYFIINYYTFLSFPFDSSDDDKNKNVFIGTLVVFGISLLLLIIYFITTAFF